ncbi:acrylyl-CoA reductase (NADPH) [Amantichitinum ursilacus]|uniref:Acrylyl-CoA reductase AcuI n=1 Tax=Amantichitinum ursilacus TaxID=857265 RepID=A0A0N0XIA0_9NEIS|nr:MDR family oxidoreductase [Amantichitinum ursilacus]KPC52530.1 Acrylyl-CoA reductase AcuI [Amantichitinum ursilacus]
MFKAILLSKENDTFNARITQIAESDLPAGEVHLQVAYSTINYKDALAITNKGPIVRQWPLVPGVDGCGTVLDSAHPDFRPGDQVILNGWGVGEKHWGCLAQQARLQADWLVPLPAAFTPEQAMALGTAGYTAMLCVMALEESGVTPGAGPVLVTGATGGVGSVAVTLLAQAGYQVAAMTGKAQSADYLRALGASIVIDRAPFATAGKPLQKEQWAGVVDTVGSHTLANACAQTRYGGAVAACGMAQGLDFPGSVAPFILRAVTLRGVDSVMAHKSLRVKAWQRLAETLDRARLTQMTERIGLGDVIAAAERIMAGQHQGRYVVDVNA